MKFRYFWNALLITIGLVLTALSMPQIIAQAQAAVRHDWDLGSATWLANLTGNLFAILLALGSLGSGTWRAVGRTTWWYFAAATGLLILGDVVVAAAAYHDVEHLSIDYVKFPLFILGVTLPILVFRTGYIGLAANAWRRRNRAAADA